MHAWPHERRPDAARDAGEGLRRPNELMDATVSGPEAAAAPAAALHSA